MKANAIVRIIIWSIVIVLLTGILTSIIWKSEASNATPHAELTASSPLYGTVSTDTQVYSSPSTSSITVANLSSGDEVEIISQEHSRGVNWVLIAAPYSGWVLADNIQIMQSALTAGPIATDESGTHGVVGTEGIRQLEIEWAAGTITIQPGSQTQEIRFWDDYSGDEKYLLSYSVSDGKLKIQFCEEDWEEFNFGIHIGGPPKKNLTVAIPENWFCENLEIEAASAKLEVHKLNFGNVEIDSASGAIGFENCSVDSLDVDTASGDLIFSGSLGRMDCDSASATIVMNLSNIPDRMDVDTASGNVDIVLPENAGFTVQMDALSGKFRSEFEYHESNGRYISGDGTCNIQVDAMSGNVNIRKDPN